MEEEIKIEEKATAEPSLCYLVGIQFSKAGKLHAFSAGEEPLALHDLVVVEGEKGPIVGTVIVPPHAVPSSEVATNIKKVLRKATDEDIARHSENREKALKAFRLCEEKIRERGLIMKLVDVNILAGDTKAIFYFSSDERVDFRGLVKDLATSLHMRIEMRQIGARDEAKSLGSFGTCGFVCCCESYLREFQSISLQMAKNQGLAPNPQKLTGQCGKLKCCLFYENELYSISKSELPGIGSKVKTPKGMGTISNLDPLRKICHIKLDEGEEDIAHFTLDEIEVIEERKRGRKKSDKDEDDEEEILHNDGD